MTGSAEGQRPFRGPRRLKGALTWMHRSDGQARLHQASYGPGRDCHRDLPGKEFMITSSREVVFHRACVVVHNPPGTKGSPAGELRGHAW